jgi:hypothetical protein
MPLRPLESAAEEERGRIQVQIPQVEPAPYPPWPERCRIYGNPTYHRHGWVSKPIRDTRLHQVRARRIQCPACGHTLRVYPEGAHRPRPGAQRAQALSILLWLLGISDRAVADVLTALGARLPQEPD